MPCNFIKYYGEIRDRNLSFMSDFSFPKNETASLIPLGYRIR